MTSFSRQDIARTVALVRSLSTQQAISRKSGQELTGFKGAGPVLACRELDARQHHEDGSPPTMEGVDGGFLGMQVGALDQ